MNHRLYFTSNQSCTEDYLGTTDNAYEMIYNWGQRLRQAMGAEEILSRNHYIGGEFRVPTFRSMAEALDRSPWTCYNKSGYTLHVVPYNSLYDGWTKNPDYHRAGFMCTCYNPYEFAYEFWDKYCKAFSPDLLDNGTFGVWSELLPEPCTFSYEDGKGILKWNADEPRVHRSKEMGRYQLEQKDCFVEVSGMSWRLARAEAYVRAWEKMISREPEDKYKFFILNEHEELVKR